MPLEEVKITRDMTTWWNCDVASLPSPSAGSSGSTSPKSTSSASSLSSEFSAWPDSCSSSSSSGAGSPPVSMSSIWGPALPVGFNPQIPPPPMSSRASLSDAQTLIRTQFHGGQGGFGAELERLFGGELATNLSPPSPTLEQTPFIPQRPSPTIPTSKTPDEDVISMPLGGFDITPKVWEDFSKNGKEYDLDDLDKMIRCPPKERKPRRLPSITELRAYDPTDPMIQRTKLLRLVSDSEASGNGPPHPWVARIKKSNQLCRFCWKNGETEVIYKSHNLKDKNNRITCPILYIYTCPLCGAKGHNAHTKKYCPLNTGDILSIPNHKTGRTSTGRRRITGSSAVPTSGLAPSLQNAWPGHSLSGIEAFPSTVDTAAMHRLWSNSLDMFLSNSLSSGLMLHD